MSELGEPDAKYVCDVDGCGESFPLKQQLGQHKRNVHGIASPRADSTKRSREKGSAKTETRKARVAKTLRELADLSDDIRGRGTSDLPEHLADLIRRDADQLATVIAKAAEQLNPVRFVTDRLLDFVTPVVGGSGLIRWLLRFWRRQLEQRQQDPAPGEWDEPEGEGVTRVGGVVA